MRAAVYEAFGVPPVVRDVPDPTPPDDGVVLRVEAAGVCRSDWHAWRGHDPDIKSLPHVPGHEFAGVVVSRGAGVKNWRTGDRVTLPFVCGCGTCPQCAAGDHHVCDSAFKPGFSHWGAFAEYVAVGFADINLVRLPDDLSGVTAASLGCRFATSFRAIVDQGRVRPDEWVVIHGCGGVGLSAIMIAKALEARVVAVDISRDRLSLARSLGADATINAAAVDDVVAAVREATAGGAHLSVDALGSSATSFNSIAGLRKRGRHVQVGLLGTGEDHPPVPLDLIVAHELEVLGSHGMQAHRYPEMMEMIGSGRLSPEKLVGKTITLDESPAELAGMNDAGDPGVTVIDRFRG